MNECGPTHRWTPAGQMFQTAVCSYNILTARHTQYDRLSQQQLSIFFFSYTSFLRRIKRSCILDLRKVFFAQERTCIKICRRKLASCSTFLCNRKFLHRLSGPLFSGKRCVRNINFEKLGLSFLASSSTKLKSELQETS